MVQTTALPLTKLTQELIDNIKKLNKSTTFLSKIMITLTIIMIILIIVQTINI